ncbi:MAG: dihydrodipicolinate reductase [Thermodesulfobacteriota bacterium]
MAYRVIQWATGNVGRAAVEGILAHPELELVGCWVHGPDKVGRDVGEVCGTGPTGVTTTGSADEVVALDADCVLYSPLLPSKDEVARLLTSGKNVVTPLGWFFPFRQGDVTDLEAACRAGRATLHGTGIHPGGITERIPLTLTALAKDVRHVRAEEFSDIRAYGAELVVREIMLFGKPPEVAARSPMLDYLGQGFQQSIDMIAAALGVALDPERRAAHETAVATARIDTPIGPIEKGTVAAQRFTWQGTVRGEPVITARVNWLMGERHLEPAWSFGAGGERFEVEITGDPSLLVTVHGLHPDDPTSREASTRNRGIVATAMHCVNAIPYVCRAEPGIRTYLDLPLVAGRAAAALRR